MNWISVKDRLPESEQRVLFCTAPDLLESEVIAGWYAAKHDVVPNMENEHYLEWRDDNSPFIAEGWYEESVSPESVFYFKIDNVTHWMPLPDAPEQIENKTEEKK